MLNLSEEYERYSSSFGKFEDVKDKRSDRPDLHAFLVLSELDPGTKNVAGCSYHDELWLSFNARIVASNATTDQIHDIIRCGIAYDEENGSFVIYS